MMTIKVFQRVLAIFLVVADIFLANGVSQADNYEDIQKYTAQINQNHFDAEAYYNRGSAYKRLGNIMATNADFARAIELGYKN